MKKYFIHNSFDAESRKQLDKLSPDNIVIDFYADYDKYSRLILPEPIPCFVNSLEYLPETKLEKTLEEKIALFIEKQDELSLDKDEILIDMLIKQQEILLALQEV